MTQNLYLGASLTPALQATTASGFLAAVAGIYRSSRDNDFSVRAAAVAEEIHTHQPDLIGLQEVSRWELTGLTSSTEDYLTILQRALAARGLDYEVAAVSVNAVIGPLPLVTPCGSATVGACRITFTDRDVILVNRDSRGLRWWNPESGNFAAQAVFTPPVPGADPVSFDRGWASIDGRFRGERFHFVTTHLEVAGFAAVQQAQAQELLSGPAFGPGVDLLVGDINSAADGSTTPTYAILRARFHDAWSVRRDGPGYTCCQAPSLDNTSSQLDERIDVILTRGARSVWAELVGDDPIQPNRPRWLSDHAGVVAALRLR
jgi:endonuclease/exonuclease/phosphatase family metal-dependent hydrolase